MGQCDRKEKPGISLLILLFGDLTKEISFLKFLQALLFNVGIKLEIKENIHNLSSFPILLPCFNLDLEATERGRSPDA